MKKTMMMLSGFLILAMSHTAMANDETRKMHGHHMHGPMHYPKHADIDNDHDTGQSGMMKDAFLVKKNIDGYTVSFHVMKAKADMAMGGSHDFMIKVEKGGKVLTDIVANSKVKHPNGHEESKMMMKMGDWYMAGYDLSHKGQHQLMVLFKTPDGKKHFGGIYYPAQ